MRALEALAVALLAVATPARAADVVTVVSLDNGEFNLPLYTPRWNGRWSQPSAAQQLVSDIARLAGHNPHVYTYLPPGRALSQGSAAWRVQPRRPRCDGASETQGDPCWCGPGDACWSGVGTNGHPDASTSLYRAVAALRDVEQGSGPRIEVHIADLFEEDPSAADDPSKSDHCVTLEGTRKAVGGVLKVPSGDVLDHLAVGILRMDVESPPPGGLYGHTFALRPEGDGGCWSARRGFPWESLRQPFSMSFAVLVLGIGTAAEPGAFDSLVAGMESQLTTEVARMELVRLRDPATAQQVETTAVWPDAQQWKPPSPARVPSVPCTSVQSQADFRADGKPLRLSEVMSSCTGALEVRFADGALERAFLLQAGLDPRPRSTEVKGSVVLEGSVDALSEAFATLGEVNESAAHRPLPLWDAVGQALDFDGEAGPGRAWAPWRHTVEVRSLEVVNLDTRPWPLVAIGSLAVCVFVGLGSYLALLKLHADRSFQTHWDRGVAPGQDPLRQRPLAQVLSDAQEEVRRRWAQRVAVAFLVACAAGALAAWLLVRLHLVRLG